MRTRCNVFPEVTVMVMANGILLPYPGSLHPSLQYWVCGCGKDISSELRGPLLPGVYFRESDWNPAAEAGVFLGMGRGLLFSEKQPLFREMPLELCE